MITLAELHRAVQTTLASKRLGQAVFARYLLFSQERPEAVLNRLAQLAGVIQGWMNQPLERITATGNLKGGQVSLLLEFRGGTTAILAWVGVPGRGDGVDLLVLGNHGAIYHDAGQADLWEEAATPSADPGAEPLRAWIERAERSGQPESAKGGTP